MAFVGQKLGHLGLRHRPTSTTNLIELPKLFKICNLVMGEILGPLLQVIPQLFL